MAKGKVEKQKSGNLLRSTQSGFSFFWNKTDLDLVPFGTKHDIVPTFFQTSWRNFRM